MSTKAEIQQVVEKIEKILGGSGQLTVSINDPMIADIVPIIGRAEVRFEMAKAKIAISYPKGSNTIIISRIGSVQSAPKPKAKQEVEPTAVPQPKRTQHSYVPPKVAKDLIDVILDEASHVMWLTGPTQCGKTVLVHHITQKVGRKLYQINCRGDMGSEAFFGEKSITIDDATKQNKIVFVKGLVEQAMVEGLDADGNEVGEAGVLFIDEAAAMPAHVAIGINRLLESDDPRRTLVIAEDGGRIVRSHSKFRIILAGNTVGRGATSSESTVYTAQMDALDISLLNRIAVCFRMGYDRNVERHILMEKIGDDKVVNQVLKFRDAIRGHIKAGKLSSPFSTKRLVDIANMYRVFRDLGKAIFYTAFEQLLPEEKPIYNEQCVAIIGKDILQQFTEDNVDYL